jgi:hypothetical protein
MIPMPRVFARIDPKQFEECFLNWVRSLNEKIAGLGALDGKTLRRSHDGANGKKALHMVSAWAAENRLVLAQVAVDVNARVLLRPDKVDRPLVLSPNSQKHLLPMGLERQHWCVNSA